MIPYPKQPKREALQGAAGHTLRHRCYARDKWKCRVPRCGARSGLHAHHIIYRSQQGPDTSWNLITVCSGHHDDIHAGHLTILPLVEGQPIDANKGVRWKETR